MRLTQCALKQVRVGFLAVVVCVAALAQSQPVLDLTLPEATLSEYPGFGFVGGSHGAVGASSGGPGRYQLPLSVQILRASTSQTGDLRLEALVRNIGVIPFELPVSRDLPEIQRPGQSRRLFSFGGRVVLPDGTLREDNGIGGAATCGSTSIFDSFQRLDPGASVQVLIPVSSTLLLAAFREGMETIQVKVRLSETILEDARYMVRAWADAVVSTNAIEFRRSGSILIPVQP